MVSSQVGLHLGLTPLPILPAHLGLREVFARSLFPSKGRHCWLLAHIPIEHSYPLLTPFVLGSDRDVKAGIKLRVGAELWGMAHDFL